MGAMKFFQLFLPSSGTLEEKCATILSCLRQAGVEVFDSSDSFAIKYEGEEWSMEHSLLSVIDNDSLIAETGVAQEKFEELISMLNGFGFEFGDEDGGEDVFMFYNVEVDGNLWWKLLSNKKSMGWFVTA